MAQLAALHFLRPGLLWALLPFALYALLLGLNANTRTPWARYISPALLPHLLSRSLSQRWLRPETLLLLCAVLACVAAAGPTWHAQSGAGDPADNPLIVVFELSRSMGGHDVSPSRAERARLELKEFLHARAPAPSALIVVAGSAHVLMPMTDDPSVLDTYVDALSPELMPFDGEAFDKAARLADALAQAATHRPTLLLISDGLTPGGSAALRALHQQRGVPLVILAVGSAQGDRARGVPALDMASLERLADATQAELIHLSFGARDLRQMNAALERARAHDQASNDARFWQDEAPALAWPLLLALAFWFRRGWVLGQVAVLLMFGSGCSAGLESVWLTPDQQGRLAFERGDYRQAAARFEDPLWQGLSFYAAEQWDRAAAAFARVDSAEALFDLGNAYAQGGKLASALHAYERALQKAPTFRVARKNRDRVRELLQSLQQDTDAEGDKHAETDHGDDVTRVNPDDLAKQPAAAPPESGARAADAASDVQAKLWLARMSTDPAEFLRRKLAVQAAREGAR